jgi:hypothetical protein
VKYFFNILAFLFILVIALPQDAKANCCSVEEICHNETQKEQNDDPCGNSDCHCICCGSISIILLTDSIIETVTQQDAHLVALIDLSFHTSNFNSTIWQPPRLG